MITNKIINIYKNTPIKIDEDIWKEYKNNYPKIKVKDNKESLVDVNNYWIIWKNYYYNRWISIENNSSVINSEMILFQNTKFYSLIKNNLLDNKCLLREWLVSKLTTINEELKLIWLQLVIMSWYRPPLVQIIAKEVFERFHTKEKANLMFANALSWPHCSWWGFDIEIADLNGKLLNTKFNSKNSMWTLFWEKLLINKKNISDYEIEVIQNRRLIFHLMKSIWCTYHLYEYWHFWYWDLLSTYINNSENKLNNDAIYWLINYNDYLDNLKNLINL